MAVNAHTHLYSGLAPFGMPAPSRPPQSFLEILRRVWWRLDRALDPAILRASARWYVADALLHGTTALIDHHESPGFIEGSLDVLADACDELGIRALLCYGATERNGGPAEARRGLAECQRFLEENRRPRVRGAVGLHASFTVGDDTICEAGALCGATSAPLHVHVAEDRADVEDARRRGYPGPLERLLALAAPPPGSILAHGVHLSAEHVELAEELGLWLVQNPRSNRHNRVGYPSELGESDRVALGTDGFPSDLQKELAALRDVVGEDPSAGERRLAAGNVLAAEIWGPEATQDRVVRDEGGRVDTVIIAGEEVVRGGRLARPGADLAAIRAEAEEAAARLWERMRSIPEGSEEEQ